MNGTDRDALELLDRGSNSSEHPADLPIATLFERQLKDRAFAVAANDGQADVRGPRAADSSAFSPLSDVDPTFEIVDRLVVEQSFDHHVVGFLDPEPWVGEPIGKLAIIGQQHKPGGVKVEPAHGVQPRATRVIHQIEHRSAHGTGFIPRRADRASWLVEHDVEVTFGFGQGSVIDLDVVGVWIDEDGQDADDFAIDPHSAFLDEQLGGPARGEACIGDHPLKTDRSRGFACSGSGALSARRTGTFA